MKRWPDRMPGLRKNVGSDANRKFFFVPSSRAIAIISGDVEAGAVTDRDDRSLRAAGDQVDRDVGLVEDLQHAKVREPERRAAAERDADRHAEELVRETVDRQRRRRARVGAQVIARLRRRQRQDRCCTG